MRSLSSALLRRVLVFFGLLLVIPLASQPGFAQSSPPTRKAPPPPPSPPATDQEQFIAYWTTETGWHSELQLRNNIVGQDLTVTPALRAADGTETLLSPVIVKPQEVKTLDIEAAVMGSAPQYIGTYGSLVLRYHSPSMRNLFAMLMIHNVGHSIAYHFDALGEIQDPQPGSREGIWWLPNDAASDYLVLTNQGSSSLQLDLSLYDSTGREAKQKIALPARATNRLSVRQILRTTGLSGGYGGIKIFAPAHAGSLDSLHLLFDEKASFSALLKMFDQSPGTTLDERDFAHTKVWTLRAPMLALSDPDPGLAFPIGTVLQPQLFIRNTLGKPANVSFRFNWRSSSTTGKAAGPSLRLAPFETRRIDVSALQAAKTLPQDANWASVILTTNGLPDQIVAVAASYDQSLQYGAQTPFSDQLAFHWEGSLWEYDPQHNSLITGGNGGSKPLQAAFTIYYNQGMQKYELEQTLQPDEQMWMDIGKLIREHVPDKNGNTLPADLTSGSYEFLDLTNNGVGALFEGKVIYDKTYGHVTYGCGGCCGYTEVAFWYNPLAIPLSLASPNGVDAYTTCSSTWDDVSTLFEGNWTTVNSSIATVNYYANHTGVAVGSTTSNAFAYLEGSSPRSCPLVRKAPSGTDNVFSGVLTPQDNFSGRSTTRFGIAEAINLSFNAQVTAAALGGLQWSIVSGGGTLTGAGTDGTGTYTAPGTAATVVLRLAIVSGAQQGQRHDYTITIVAPSDGLLVKNSNVRHTQGYISVGFRGLIFLDPTDVSFANLQFAEGSVSAVASGYFASLNGSSHPPTTPPASIGSCDSVIGCQVLGVVDTVDTNDDPPPFSTGDFLWAIPWQYQAPGGVLTTFTTANHHSTANAAGTATIQKAGAGPFSKNATDPTTSY
jgi:hypothetical protein